MTANPTPFRESRQAVTLPRTTLAEPRSLLYRELQLAPLNSAD
jgi:hypothetical protein